MYEDHYAGVYAPDLLQMQHVPKPYTGHRRWGAVSRSCATGAHAAAVGSFVILGSSAPDLDVVYGDILGEGLFVEKAKELERYKLAFEYLRDQALDISGTECVEAWSTFIA